MGGARIHPHHEFFFSELARDDRFDLHVEMLSGPTSSHPFTQAYERNYSWHVSDAKRGIDKKLIARVLADGNAAVLVASYLYPTLVQLMKELHAVNRPFIYFTDTPLSQAERWVGDKMKKRSWVRRIARAARLRWIFAHASRVLATGNVGVEAVVSLGSDPRTSSAFPFFVALPPISDPSVTTPVRFLTVGQINKRKGWDVALAAFIHYHENEPSAQWSWEIIGDGPDRREFEAAVADANLCERVRFSGWLNTADVHRAFSEGDVLLHPARWDPFPVVVLEAMAAGLAVLGSARSGSAVDRVAEGSAGLIHEVGNVQQLVGHIGNVLQDQNRLQAMRRNARKSAEEWPAERGVEILFNCVEALSKSLGVRA